MHALLLLSALLTSAPAAELAGVTLPDTATAPGGSALVLNGLGLREHWLGIDIYVGGLYLPNKTTDATKAVTSDVPKRVVMSFIYRKVSRSQMIETFTEGFARIGKTEALANELAQLEGMITADILAGQVVTIDYEPGAGTTFSFNGEKKGTIAGAEFMQAVWSIFVGPKPASEQLKKGMLGG